MKIKELIFAKEEMAEQPTRSAINSEPIDDDLIDKELNKENNFIEELQMTSDFISMGGEDIYVEFLSSNDSGTDTTEDVGYYSSLEALFRDVVSTHKLSLSDMYVYIDYDDALVLEIENASTNNVVKIYKNDSLDAIEWQSL